jgi:glycine/D-amino acid oxidase-like deaminating enzyme
MYEIDTHLSELARRLGWERAARCYQISLNAVRTLAEVARGLDEPCEFVWRKSLYLARRRSDVRQLQDECEARRRAGINVDLLGPDEIARLFPFEASAALLSHEAGEVDPLRLTRGLLRRAMSRGARLFSRTAVARIEQTSHGPVLATVNGPSIHARRVVLAAGYETPEFLRNAPGSLHSTYVLCSRPMPQRPIWHEDWLIWETSRPYVYLRTTCDGRIMIGGADVPFKNATARDALLDRQTRRLQKRFAQMFPDVPFETEFAWTGTFGESADGLPYVGEAADIPGCLVAMGYGGNGMTWGVVAAEVIRDACLGRTNPDAKLFAFDR